jgi:hypothetical protein
MLELLLAWFLLLVLLLVFAVERRPAAGALTLAYFLALSLIHVPGVLPLIASHLPIAHEAATMLGFQMTIIGMAAFVAGAIAARTMKLRPVPHAASSNLGPRQYERLAKRMLFIGLVSYFVVLPVARIVPSLTSVVYPFGTMIILGVWLWLFSALKQGDRRRVISILALLPLFPIATLALQGFLGFGVYWILSSVAFLFLLIRRGRIWFYIAAGPTMYLGLCLFVTYMGQRTELREVIWHEKVGLTDRLDQMTSLVTKFQTLDLDSPLHVASIEDRLNQNYLVGAAIVRHDNGWLPYAYGATVPIWALIPRAVWPGKPAVGGSGSIVSDVTGLRVAEGTSFGVGQVLEFYVNFGVPGEIVGFFLLGLLFMRLDRRIMASIDAFDIRGVLVRALPGLTLLQPGGSLLEMLVACAAAYLAAQIALSVPILGLTPLLPRTRPALS